MRFDYKIIKLTSKKNKKNIFLLYILMGILIGAAGCTDSFKFFSKETAYQRYIRSLKEASLESTALAKDFISAGVEVAEDSTSIILPFSEAIYFSPEKPRAAGYIIKAHVGEIIVVNVKPVKDMDAKMFIDIFEMGKGKDISSQPVASAEDSSNSVIYEIENDGNYFVRLQPELLRFGLFKVKIVSESVLSFPIRGKTALNISSVWGDPRDGGKRKHEGVDIMAPKDTPILAVADGYVSFVGWNNLGGNVVSEVDLKRGLSYYYAHMDIQLVKVGDHVRVGDTLGLVGNTGDAITTPYHLHFGIYTFSQGAINPYPYLYQDPKKPYTVNADITMMGKWVRIKDNKSELKNSPFDKARTVERASAFQPVMITGDNHNWYRVALADGQTAYVKKNAVENADRPIESRILDKDYAFMYNNYGKKIIIDSLKHSSYLSVLAKSGSLLYVKDSHSRLGWISLD